MTTFGVNAHPDTHTAHHETYGGSLGYTRFFFGPGNRFGWNHSPLSKRRPGDVPIISVQTWNEQDFRSLLENRPDDVSHFAFCIMNEPEGQLLHGTLDANELRQWYSRARYIRDHHENGYRCHLVGILSNHALTVRRFDWHRLQGALEMCDLVGVDTYAVMDDLKANRYTSADELFSTGRDIADELLTDWAVPEFGCLVAADGNRSRHADQLVSYIAHVNTQGALWMSYWCNIGLAGASYHLDGGCSESLAAWKAAVRATAVLP